MFTITKDLPGEIIRIKVSGKTTKESYKHLNPIMKHYEKRHQKAKLLIEVEDFDYTASAFFEDMKFSFEYMDDISAMAVVSEKSWLDKGATVFNKLMPNVASKGFEACDYEKALNWLELQ